MNEQVSSDPLPYTQIDRAVKPKAATLSSMIGVTYQHALGSLIDFWDLNGDPRDLERLLADGKDEVLLTRDEVRMRFMMASGKEIEPLQLAALGILEPKADLFRVRGMSRFFAPLRRRQQAREAASKGGLKTASNAKRSADGRFGGAGAVDGAPVKRQPSETPSDSQAEHQAPASTEDSGQRTADRDGLKDLAGKKLPAESKPPKPLKPEKPPDPRHHPLKLRLIEVYADENFGALYDFGGRDAKAVADLLAKSDDDEEIVFRWRTAIRLSLDKFHTPKTRTIPDLVEDWNAYPVVKNANAPQREIRL